MSFHFNEYSSLQTRPGVSEQPTLNKIELEKPMKKHAIFMIYKKLSTKIADKKNFKLTKFQIMIEAPPGLELS